MNPHWHRLRFFVVDAWDELRHSPGVNLLAAGTLVAVLSSAGLALLALVNVQGWIDELRADARVDVYLEDEIDDATRDAIAADLRAVEGVRTVEYVDKAQALDRYARWSGGMAELVDALQENPLPASFEVVLDSGEGAESVGSELVVSFGRREGVEQVRFDREWLGRIEAFLALVRVGGGMIAVIVLAAVVFVMASVLRLAVYARRDEIEIMLLVGATPAFVRGPFVVAGIAQGVISAVGAFALIEAARRSALAYAGSESLALVPMVLSRPLPLKLGLAILAVSLTVSCTAAWFAVRHSQGLRIES